jgi:hypothetical protein
MKILIATVLLTFCVSEVLAQNAAEYSRLDSGSRARAVLALAKAKEKEKIAKASPAPAPVVIPAQGTADAQPPVPGTQETAPVQFYYPQYDRPRLFNGGFFRQSSQCPSGR